MAAPEFGAGVNVGWLEGFGAFLLLLLTLGGQAWRYVTESKKDDQSPRHVVMESAELADLSTLRDLAKRLADLYPLVEASEEMLAILRRMDQEDRVRKEVATRLREERLEADREADREMRRRPGRD